jgi:DNA-3-methyladenine glycosylase
MKLNRTFYQHEDVVYLAKELLGKTVYTNFNGDITSGIICETEAYCGVSDKASHAFGGKRSQRTEIMYHDGGKAYIYLCYGMHSLFNVVTNKKDVPHAVLIRGIIPDSGIEKMLERTGKSKIDISFGIGPGKVAKALGIHFRDSGIDLTGNKIWIEDNGALVHKKDIIATQRIGVDYAGEDAKLPYRFVWKPKIND